MGRDPKVIQIVIFDIRIQNGIFQVNLGLDPQNIFFFFYILYCIPVKSEWKNLQYMF